MNKGQDAQDSEEEMFKRTSGRETMAEEEARIKNEFKKAHDQDSESDGFLVTKPRKEDSDSEGP